MSIDSGGRRWLAWLGTEMGYRPLRADLGTLTGHTEVSRHRRREVVQITLGSGFEAMTQFRAALADRGLDFETVTEIPFDIELVGTGSVWGMFGNCLALTTVPAMDTSNVTNMAQMFTNCSSLTTVPDMDTSNVTEMFMTFAFCSSLTTVPDMDTSNMTSMLGMFGACESLTYVPDMDTSKVTTMGQMFYGCAALTDGNVRLIGRHPDVDTAYMIADSGLTREPFYDTDGNPI